MSTGHTREERYPRPIVETMVGVVVGALLAYTIQGLGKRQDITLQARLILGGTYRFLFADAEWSALNSQLHRLRIYLELAHVPAVLIERIEHKAKECWRDSRKQAEEHYDPEIGHAIALGLLDQYRDLEKKANASLGKRWIGCQR